MPRRPGRAPSLPTPAFPVVHLARDHMPPTVVAQLRAGAWLRLRPGAYIDTPVATDPHARDRLVALGQVAAAIKQLRTPCVLSHESAALVWGLPLLRLPDRCHVIGVHNPSNDPSDIVRHVHTLGASERATRLGLPVTTLERTVVDCAMSLGAQGGLVVADAALHAGASRTRCLEIIDRMIGRRGVVTARAVLALADDGAESPGESSARFVLLRAGLPAPQTQVRVKTHLGTFWSDLGWPEWQLLAEYDGRAKYEANGPASAAVILEKRRQDAIEEAGFRVLRITAEDLRDDDGLIRRVIRAAPRGAAGRLRPRRALVGPAPTAGSRRRREPRSRS